MTGRVRRRTARNRVTDGPPAWQKAEYAASADFMRRRLWAIDNPGSPEAAAVAKEMDARRTTDRRKWSHELHRWDPPMRFDRTLMSYVVVPESDQED